MSIDDSLDRVIDKVKAIDALKNLSDTGQFYMITLDKSDKAGHELVVSYTSCEFRKDILWIANKLHKRIMRLIDE